MKYVVESIIFKKVILSNTVSRILLPDSQFRKTNISKDLFVYWMTEEPNSIFLSSQDEFSDQPFDPCVHLPSASIDDKGRIFIPKAFREGLLEDTLFEIRPVSENTIKLVPSDEPAARRRTPALRNRQHVRV